MEAQAFQIGAALLAICIVAVVISCTKWLVVSERTFPREFFPLTKSDRIRGVLAGLAIGVAWAVCDTVLNRLRHRPGWDPQNWEFRCAMLVMFVLAGRLTFAEIFRAIRCRRNAPPPTG